MKVKPQQKKAPATLIYSSESSDDDYEGEEHLMLFSDDEQEADIDAEARREPVRSCPSLLYTACHMHVTRNSAWELLDAKLSEARVNAVAMMVDRTIFNQ